MFSPPHHPNFPLPLYFTPSVYRPGSAPADGARSGDQQHQYHDQLGTTRSEKSVWYYHQIQDTLQNSLRRSRVSYRKQMSWSNAVPFFLSFYQIAVLSTIPLCHDCRAVILNWRFSVNDYWKVMHSKREKINFRIKRSSIFLVNQIYELELCQAISVEIATQSGQEFSLKTANL